MNVCVCAEVCLGTDSCVFGYEGMEDWMERVKKQQEDRTWRCGWAHSSINCERRRTRDRGTEKRTRGTKNDKYHQQGSWQQQQKKKRRKKVDRCKREPQQDAPIRFDGASDSGRPKDGGGSHRETRRQKGKSQPVDGNNGRKRVTRDTVNRP